VNPEKDNFADVYMEIIPNVSDDLKQRVVKIGDMLFKIN